MRILIVEDEKQLSDAVAELLRLQKFTVDAVYNGVDGLDYAMSNIYDVIVLDIMLPKMNGLEALKKMREEGVSTPILLLSAKSTVQDKITGLNVGADDYLAKPFDSAELVARIKALTRRKSDFVGDVLSGRSVTLDKNSHELTAGNQSIRLGIKEYQIMEMLLSNIGIVLPKERLIEKIWGYDSEAEYNTIEVYISFLRKKLTAINAKVAIRSLRGIGYKLEENND